MLLPLFMFLFWFVLWVSAYFLIRKKSSSTIISVGGSLITSIILWIGFMFMLIPFIGERKQNYNDGYKTDTAYSTNKVEKEKNNTEGLELQINVRKKIVENKTIIYGETNLPEGTKLGVSIEKLDKRGPQDFNIYVRSGRFSSQPLTSHGDLLENDFDVQLFTYFNQTWQPSEKLRADLKMYKSPYLTNEYPMGIKFQVVKNWVI